MFDFVRLPCLVEGAGQGRVYRGTLCSVPGYAHRHKSSCLVDVSTSIFSQIFQLDTQTQWKEMASLSPYVDVHGDGTLAPLGLSLGHSSALFLVVGAILLGLFFVLEGGKTRPNAAVSLIVAALSSLALGFGFVFTFMWAGIFM